jgi:hypothetical protein
MLAWRADAGRTQRDAVIAALLLFDLAPHAQLQLRAVPVSDSDESFAVRRARAGADGHLTDDVTLETLVQIADSVESPPGDSPVRLLDAKLRWEALDCALPGAGLGKVPVSRSNLARSHELALPERAYAVESSERGGLVPSRRLGATVEADLGMVAYEVGFFRGAEGHATDSGEGRLAAARADVFPIGRIPHGESALERGDDWYDWPRVAVGGSAAFHDREAADRWVAATDLRIRYRGFALLAELLHGRVALGDGPAEDRTTAYGQAGLLLIRDRLEVAVRYDWTDDGVRAATGGTNLFLWGDHVKLQASHTHGDTPRGRDETIVQVGLWL